MALKNVPNHIQVKPLQTIKVIINIIETEKGRTIVVYENSNASVVINDLKKPSS